MLDDASMRQQAVKMGIIDTTKDALKPQQKALVAQALILKQTGDAQGDFARTSGGLANQQKILKAQFENVQASIGRKLLPVALKLASWANDKLIPAITNLWNWVSQKLGPAFKVWASVAREMIGRLTGAKDGTDKLGNAMRDAAPLINVLKSAGKALAVVFKSVVLPAMRFIYDNALPAMGKMLGFVGRMWTSLWNDFVQPAVRFILRGVGWMMDGWSKMLRGLSKVPGFGWAAKAADVMEGAAREAYGLADEIKKIPTSKNVRISVDVPNLRAVSDELDWVARPRQARITITQTYANAGRETRGGLQARAMGGPVAAGTPYLVGERGPEIIVPSTNGTVIPNHKLGTAAGGQTFNIHEASDARATAYEVARMQRFAGVA